MTSCKYMATRAHRRIFANRACRWLQGTLGGACNVQVQAQPPDDTTLMLGPHHPQPYQVLDTPPPLGCSGYLRPGRNSFLFFFCANVGSSSAVEHSARFQPLSRLRASASARCSFTSSITALFLAPNAPKHDPLPPLPFAILAIMPLTVHTAPHHKSHRTLLDQPSAAPPSRGGGCKPMASLPWPPPCSRLSVPKWHTQMI
jgi:hypothetical protein